MKQAMKFIFIFTLVLPMGVLADEDMQFSLDSWVSEGQTKWRHDASKSDLRLGVPSSELDYQNVNSNVVEFGLRNRLANGHILKLALGTGAIDSGLLVDDDYLSAYGATYYSASQSGNHRFSRTHSDINGSGLSYFNGEFSPQDFFVNTGRLDMRFAFALHYWQEEYTATGVRQIECTTASLCTPGFSGYYGVNVITNRVEWTSFGLAMDGVLNVTNKLEIELAATFYPLVSLTNEDTHHLRSDLAQNPSVRMTGNGSGYDLTLALRYHLAEQFSAHIGYRVWERWVQNQTITFYGADGGSSSAELLEFRTRRDGIFAGVSFQFR